MFEYGYPLFKNGHIVLKEVLKTSGVYFGTDHADKIKKCTRRL
jgi:hypothetical protein